MATEFNMLLLGSVVIRLQADRQILRRVFLGLDALSFLGLSALPITVAHT